MGGKFHLKLNIDERPIVKKYREGKMKRTLKRELKVLEIVEKEALEIRNYNIVIKKYLNLISLYQFCKSLGRINNRFIIFALTVLYGQNRLEQK